MARRPRASQIETRTARLKLAARKKPYAFTIISPGIALAYRRNQGAGTWVVRVADGRGSNWTKGFAIADDHEEANGSSVLSFWEAQDKARALARGNVDDGRPCTVSEAIDAYEADLRARGGLVGNATHIRFHLPPSLAAKAVSLLGSRELQRWRDSLAVKIKAASVNRVMKSVKAALNLAARHDTRIVNTNAWRIGLAALPDAHRARNVVLHSDQVRRLITEAYAEDGALGLLVELAATTGARPSQLWRLEVGDLQTDHADGCRLLMPSSAKGKGRKRISRYPVPIPVSLAGRLRQAAGGREASAPLLLRTNGKPWRINSDYRRPFLSASARAGLPSDATFYSLRHTNISKLLLAGVPVRIVASARDTSTGQIELHYAAFIADHSDSLLRTRLFDAAEPAAGNVIALPGRGS
jgi:integrase